MASLRGEAIEGGEDRAMAASGEKRRSGISSSSSRRHRLSQHPAASAYEKEKKIWRKKLAKMEEISGENESGENGCQRIHQRGINGSIGVKLKLAKKYLAAASMASAWRNVQRNQLNQ
jgi:hypothetical protein